MTDSREKVLAAIKESLPKFFRIKEQSILGQKTIYNLLSQGRGPEVVDLAGGKFLERDSFLAWLESRSRNTLKRGRKRSAA